VPDATHVGRRYEACGQVIEGDRAKAVGLAIAGENQPYEPEVVPPTYAAVYCLFPTLAQLFGDDEVGISLAGLVHGEQSFEWPASVHAGDVVDSTAEIASVEDKRGMTFVGIDLKAVRQSDQVTVCTGRALMIVRGGGA
jgi:N-terminal half of MaoC dehydratase